MKTLERASGALHSPLTRSEKGPARRDASEPARTYKLLRFGHSHTRFRVTLPGGVDSASLVVQTARNGARYVEVHAAAHERLRPAIEKLIRLGAIEEIRR